MSEYVHILGSLMAGTAVAMTTLALLGAAPKTVEDKTKRIIKHCDFYRFFLRWIEDLKAFLAPRIKSRTSILATLLRVNNVEYNLRRGENCDHWDINSWVSREVFRSGVIGLVAFGFMLLFVSPFAAAFYAALISYFKYLLTQINLAKRSKSWNCQFHQRLPFTIDLIALTMKAGSTIEQSLNAVLEENEGHPIADEFGLILQQHQNGTPLLECFENFRDRMRDKDVNEIVFTAINAERYGGANADTYLGLAEQMRMRRSQRAEKAIGEAKTMMALPNLLFLMAGMLAIAGPFGMEVFPQLKSLLSL